MTTEQDRSRQVKGVDSADGAQNRTQGHSQHLEIMLGEEEPLKEIAKEQPARGEKTRKVQCPKSQGKKIILKKNGSTDLAEWC